jgi:hypothetical protein
VQPADVAVNVTSEPAARVGLLGLSVAEVQPVNVMRESANASQLAVEWPFWFTQTLTL